MNRWQSVESLFQQALQRPQAERDGFLREACGGDSSLFREVASLLANHDRESDGFGPWAARAAEALIGGRPVLADGTRLGPYQINGFIAAGGMGEVYRARDIRLGRFVAIKVLRGRASNLQTIERFEREARAASALNHPNICTVHDIGTDPPFIAMELLEGETVQQRLSRESFELTAVVEIAVPLADALAAAHAAGILHRDIKPANVFLTEHGPKILDFGLAKAVESPLSSAGSSSPVQSIQPSLTEVGDTVGTVTYMSPEQLRGEDLDARTDLFSLGLVLYEMVARRPAFTGPTVAVIAAATLHDPPIGLRQLRPDVSPLLERIIVTALQKDRNLRYQKASDLKADLRRVQRASAANLQAQLVSNADAPSGRVREGGRHADGDHSASPQLDSDAVQPGTIGRASDVASKRLRERGESHSDAQLLSAHIKRHRGLIAVLGLISVAVSLAAYAVMRERAARTVQSRVYRSSWLPPPPPIGDAGRRMALSPDGTRFATVGRDSSGRTLLWVRPLDQLTAFPLEGTDGATAPFWSPDGRSIAFFSGGKLRRINASGGPVVAISDAPGPGAPAAGTWSREDMILFVPLVPGPIFKVSASGGAPVQVTEAKREVGENTHQAPFFLPDNRHFLYSAGDAPNSLRRVYVGSIDSPDRTLILEDAWSARYSEGFLLFRRGTTLVAQPFDPARLVLSGSAVPVVDQVRFTNSLRTGGGFTVSANGVLAFQGDSTLGTPRLKWFDRTGKEVGTLGEPLNYASVNLSPDGRKLSASIVDADGAGDIWLLDLGTAEGKRLTFGPAREMHGIWSRDGTRLAFDSSRSGDIALYQRPSNGAGRDELVSPNPTGVPHSWSPDGQFILFTKTSPKTSIDLWILPLMVEQKPRVFIQTDGVDGRGQFSPDGRWVAYASSEIGGRNEIYLVGFPHADGRRQVTTMGGDWPRWSRDGRELFFVSDNTLMSVPVKADRGHVETGVATPLFDLRVPGSYYGWDYDVSPDGQRFLVITIDERPPSLIDFVINWTKTLPQ